MQPCKSINNRVNQSCRKSRITEHVKSLMFNGLFYTIDILFTKFSHTPHKYNKTVYVTNRY